ncbi:hypothetical protein GOP47_0023015 [Adiantum capillus-veneris]|uniref:Uncharacterized protein n=1 Tax=Adiantum capillus-veneris TaxID=13818 RepID=A0A9D4U8U1_ADICA|nr:hypothetical protein GOP47_0023015 [Adiantum capillus-veneris]
MLIPNEALTLHSPLSLRRDLELPVKKYFKIQPWTLRQNLLLMQILQDLGMAFPFSASDSFFWKNNAQQHGEHIYVGNPYIASPIEQIPSNGAHFFHSPPRDPSPEGKTISDPNVEKTQSSEADKVDDALVIDKKDLEICFEKLNDKVLIALCHRPRPPLHALKNWISTHSVSKNVSPYHVKYLRAMLVTSSFL